MKKIQKYVISVYKKTLSKLIKTLFGGGCRYYPTCSDYSRKAIEEFGWFKGTILSIKRLSRCHPFSKEAYYDPLPNK